MERYEIGFMLSEMRGDAKRTKNLGSHAIISIESGRSSYPVANLVTYCNDYSITFNIVKRRPTKRYAIRTIDDIHEAIRELMELKNVNLNHLRMAINSDLSTKKIGKNIPISIDTLISVLDYFECELEFIKTVK